MSANEQPKPDVVAYLRALLGKPVAMNSGPLKRHSAQAPHAENVVQSTSLDKIDAVWLRQQASPQADSVRFHFQGQPYGEHFAIARTDLDAFVSGITALRDRTKPPPEQSFSLTIAYKHEVNAAARRDRDDKRDYIEFNTGALERLSKVGIQGTGGHEVGHLVMDHCQKSTEFSKKKHSAKKHSAWEQKQEFEADSVGVVLTGPVAASEFLVEDFNAIVAERPERRASAEWKKGYPELARVANYMNDKQLSVVVDRVRHREDDHPADIERLARNAGVTAGDLVPMPPGYQPWHGITPPPKPPVMQSGQSAPKRRK